MQRTVSITFFFISVPPFNVRPTTRKAQRRKFCAPNPNPTPVSSHPQNTATESHQKPSHSTKRGCPTLVLWGWALRLSSFVFRLSSFVFLFSFFVFRFSVPPILLFKP